jgi:hypothetical protein
VSGPERFDVGRFAQAYQELAEAVVRAAPPTESPFARLLREHLGRDTTDLSVVAMDVEEFDQPNLQRALEALGSESDVEVVRVIGIRGPHRMYGGISLAALTQPEADLEIGPVDYVESIAA